MWRREPHPNGLIKRKLLNEVITLISIYAPMLIVYLFKI